MSCIRLTEILTFLGLSRAPNGKLTPETESDPGAAAEPSMGKGCAAPVKNGTLNGVSTSRTPFGRQMCQEHFLFEEGFVNLNHGSFGTYPKSVRDKLRSFQDAAEAAPDRFIRYEYPRLLDVSRAALADFLKVPVEEIVIIANATTAVNAVLRNLRFEENDLIVSLDCIYGACQKTIDYITETTPAESVKVEYTYPISDDALVKKFDDTLAAYPGRVRVALFETIASLPGVRLPFERLTEVARSHGVLSLIDGAHGVGHLPLDLTTLNPDFFVSNCHKWLLTPRGCAVFYVPERNQHLLRTSLPTSHYFEPLPRPGVPPTNNPLPPTGKSNFVSQFEFVGSVDNAPFLCIPEALRFRQEVCGGEDAIMNYCFDLARNGGRLVAQILSTEVMDNEEHTLTRQCCMVNVRLPLQVIDDEEGTPDLPSGIIAAVPRSHTSIVTQFLTSACVTDHATFIALIFYRNVWWARLSAQIYLESTDFEHGAQLLKSVCLKVAQKAYMPTLPKTIACG